MFAALAHFFRESDAVGILYNERVPTNSTEVGFQVPDAMVALTATAVSTRPLAHRSW